MYVIDHTVAFAIDAPIKASHIQQIDQNIDELDARFNITTGHDHDGVDSKLVASVANSAIGQAQLKTTTGSVSTTANADLTLPGGEYGFYPQVKAVSSGVNGTQGVQIAIDVNSTTYSTIIGMYAANGDGTTLYAQQRYIQASPPYLIGQVIWGHFLFLLRDIATGTPVAAYEAEDPPWAYNGALHLMERDPGRIAAVPHPFADYWQKDPAIDGLEIVLVDLTMRNIKKAKQDSAKIGKGILEDIPALIAGKGKPNPYAAYGLPNIPRFTDKVKIYEP